MKVFVTGATGQLGYDVTRQLLIRNFEVLASGFSQIDASVNDYFKVSDKYLQYVSLDISDKSQVLKVLEEYRPDVIIHCAAWTAVDLAEDEINQNAVTATNVTGTRNLVEGAELLSSKFLYISTDYVFDGEGQEPWEADCKDFKPLNVYGKSKLKGEQIVAEQLEKYFIVRIAWVFGEHGNNFVKTMLKVGKRYNKVNVVCDQIGTPTYTWDLSRLLIDMMLTEKYGYYHATNEGEYISWYDFVCEIYSQIGYDTEVIPVTTEEYGFSKAKRPFNSRLDRRKLVEAGFSLLPTWKDALKRYLKCLKLT